MTASTPWGAHVTVRADQLIPGDVLVTRAEGRYTLWRLEVVMVGIAEHGEWAVHLYDEVGVCIHRCPPDEPVEIRPPRP